MTLNGLFLGVFVMMYLRRIFNPDNPLARHSRAGRNPAKTKVPQSGQNEDVAPLSRAFFINWIPACGE